jgi:aryl-alcohol dehydrogenase-like predicted oxidoreductase
VERRRLGPLEVSALGLGCMGMSEFYGPGDEAESIASIHRALDLGIDLLDTADMYGPYKNEELIGRAIRDRRDRVVLATKCGIVREPGNARVRGLNGRPEYIRSACEASLKRLGVAHVDLYQLHRVDPSVPIEESVGALADLVKAGKTRAIGLSEAGPRTLRRACAVHPIASLQTEYSLLARDVEPEVLPTCRELGVGFLAYSPLGRGLLTGRWRSRADFTPDDYRLFSPRFAEGAIERNLSLVERVGALAARKGCTASQLSLAWLLHRGDDIVPIPGTKSRARLEENAAAARVSLSAAELAALDSALPPGSAQGGRYPDAMKPHWD